MHSLRAQAIQKYEVYAKKNLHWALICLTCIPLILHFLGRFGRPFNSIYVLYYSESIQYSAQPTLLICAEAVSINHADFRSHTCNSIVTMWRRGGFAGGKNGESVRTGGNHIIWEPTSGEMGETSGEMGETLFGGNIRRTRSQAPRNKLTNSQIDKLTNYFK